MTAWILFALSPLAPAYAAQGSGCLPTTGIVGGLTMTNDTIAAIAALISSNSGSSAPATDCSAAAVQGQFWLDTTSGQYKKLKYYDGTNWLVVATLDATNHLSIEPIGGGSASIASAATTDLWSTPEASITVTGTTSITQLANASAVPGTLKLVQFAGALTLTYDATKLILPTAANITTAAGDYAIVLALSSTNVSVISYNRASGAAVAPFGALTSLASAGTTDLGTIQTHNVNVTGTATITAFGSSAVAASPVYLLKFAGALQVTYNAASLITPGATNITTAANDTAVAYYLGSGNWQIVSYSRATANVAGKAPTVQAFTSGSGATYTTPTNPSPLYLIVEMIGPGGGGGGATANNGAASVTPNTVFGAWTAVTGSGGNANGGAGGAGGTGGTNSTGSLIFRQNGGAGTAGANSTGGGMFGSLGGAGPYGGAGAGASSFTGGAGVTNSGAGGAGGGNNTGNIGAGGGAGEFVKFLISSPASSYTYTVGVGGLGGAAGANAGGPGAAGRIIVYEHYN